MPFKNPKTASDYRKKYMKKHYLVNRNERIAKKNARLNDLKSWFREYRSHLKCTRCTENHPACLDFHHLGNSKEMDISSAVRNGWGKDRILKEIEKCIVLCSNCHRKEHHGLVV